VTGTRYGGSVGLTASFHGFGITLAAMGYLPQTIVVTDSAVLRSVSGLTNQEAAQPSNYPVTIGNGTYTTNLWVASIGLSYSG